MINLEQRIEAQPVVRTPRLERVLPLSLALLDIALIYTAFVLAYWVRYFLKIGPTIQDQLTFSRYLPIGFLLLGVMMPVLLSKGAYRLRLSTDLVEEFTVIFSAATISIASIVVLTAMLHKFQYSRGVIIYLWIFVIVLMAIGRLAYHAVQRLCYQRGWGVRRLVVVGTTDVAKLIMQGVINRADLGYHLVGFVEHRETAPVADFGRFHALGRVGDLPDLIENNQVEEIIVAIPASAHEEVWPVLSLCERHGVGLKLVPDLFEMSLSRVQVDDIAGIPVLNVREQPLRRMASLVKRAMDIVIGSLMLLICLPLLVVLAALIRFESSGSALLWQDRMGLKGRPFRCLKLRTMKEGAEALQPSLLALNESQGPLFKLRDDPRCTRVGRRIRRWSLDELPQLWNVVRGEMSLVGPRPPLPHEVATYSPLHMRRLEAKPGLTGIWQVSGRSKLLFDEMIMMDIHYVDNWSLGLDLRVLMKTVMAVLARHGAY